MYWEARGEDRAGMRAVGHVVMNRIADDRFPNEPCAVVHHGGEEPGCQFSWYCDGMSDQPADTAEWRTARSLARELMNGSIRDTTRGALFFHAKRLKAPWRAPRTRTVVVGKHVFYR